MVLISYSVHSLPDTDTKIDKHLIFKKCWFFLSEITSPSFKLEINKLNNCQHYPVLSL